MLIQTDYVGWLNETITLLKQKNFDQADWENLIEEIEILVVGSSRLCVIIFAYVILKCLFGKTFRTILRIFYQYRPRFHTETRRAGSLRLSF
jgi:hypothetical protein